MKKIEFYAMGCQMSALVDADSEAAVSHLVEVPAWFEEWERSLSRFRPESELNQLNDRSGESVTVSETLWEVLQLSLRVAHLSQGIVIPTLLGALEAAGYDRSFEILQPTLPGPSSLSDPFLSQAAWQEIHLDPYLRRVTLPPGVRLDLGGVAKGWAAHQAMLRLAAYGPALVDASGDIAISAGLWSVGVADPFQPEEDLELVWVRRNGVATSGRDYRRWKKNGAWQHHLIDPRTALPAETDVLSATVIAPDVIEAEMAAKIALILGSQKGLEWLSSHPSLAGLLVLEDHHILYTEHFSCYLKINQ